MSIILATEESEIRRISVKGSLGKQTLSATGRMAQVVKCLPRKCEALTSNPSTTKKKKKTLESYVIAQHSVTLVIWKKLNIFSPFSFSGQSHYIDQARLKLKILLPPPSRCWSSRHAPPCLAER
jgi:hypothetical protein